MMLKASGGVGYTVRRLSLAYPTTAKAKRIRVGDCTGPVWGPLEPVPCQIHEQGSRRLDLTYIKPPVPWNLEIPNDSLLLCSKLVSLCSPGWP